jgi:hypothetical protein
VYVLLKSVRLKAFTDAVPESTFVAERSRLLRLPKLTTSTPGARCASSRVRVLWSVPDILLTNVCYGVDCRKQCHDSADASQHFAIFRSCQTLTLKPSTTVFDELTTTQPPPSSVRACADRLPDPDSTTSSLPLSSKARPRGRASPVATTCHLYPDATEGLIFPEGESRHDD